MLRLALVTTPRLPAPSLARRSAEHLKGWWLAYRRNRRLRATIHTLHGLDDRTLGDIGLDRSEIESVVRSRGTERRQGYVDFGGVTPRG